MTEAERAEHKLSVKQAKAKRKRIAREMRRREAGDPNLRLANRTSHTGNQQ